MADKTTAAHHVAEIVSTASGVITSENIAYLMGLSLIVGSLFTVFTLVLLDFMKRDRVTKEND